MTTHTDPRPPEQRRFRDQLRFGSRVRYLLWRMFNAKKDIAVTMHDGATVVIRPAPTQDFAIIREVFLLDTYLPPKDWDFRDVRRIVDLGANVGLSVVYFSKMFPAANIVAYEPHPVHVAQVQKQVQHNRLADRVTLRPVAAGGSEGAFFLSDAGPESTLSSNASPGSIRVEVVDFFRDIAGEPIDFMKVDIEGGEWPILEDVRFASIRPRFMVLEWHADGHGHDANWLKTHLHKLGYETRDGIFQHEKTGMIWARLR